MYDNNGDVFGLTYNGVDYYYIKNAQNDVVAIADSSGVPVVKYYYYAYGAKADPRAAESRQILRDVGIEPLTAPRNLVVLPQSYHASLHTTAYHNYVTERLRPVAGNKEGVEATLDSIRTEILARSAAGIRWD